MLQKKKRRCQYRLFSNSRLVIDFVAKYLLLFVKFKVRAPCHTNAPNGTRGEYATPDPRPTRLTSGLNSGAGPAKNGCNPDANYDSSARAEILDNH